MCRRQPAYELSGLGLVTNLSRDLDGRESGPQGGPHMGGRVGFCSTSVRLKEERWPDLSPRPSTWLVWSRRRWPHSAAAVFCAAVSDSGPRSAAARCSPPAVAAAAVRARPAARRAAVVRPPPPPAR